MKRPLSDEEFSRVCAEIFLPNHVGLTNRKAKRIGMKALRGE
jgi:hypothetical protein